MSTGQGTVAVLCDGEGKRRSGVWEPLYLPYGDLIRHILIHNISCRKLVLASPPAPHVHFSH